MSAEVDVTELAIERRPPAPAANARRSGHWVSRYAIPGALVAGFAALAAWAVRDVAFPPHEVWVTPVLAARTVVANEGSPLFQAAGWIEPRPTPVRVAALSPGVVERLLVVQDQAVKAGEPVAELVKADALLAADRAAANLMLREAELAKIQAAVKAASTRLSQPVHLEASLGEAEAALAAIATDLKNLPFELRRAEAQAEFAKKDYEGKQAAKGAIAGRIINEARSTLDAANALVEELKSRAASLASQQSALVQRRDALKTQLALLAEETQAKEGADADLRAATARVDQAKVALAEAKLRLERMTVRAPIDGRVYQLVGYPGTTLTGGMSPLANADGSTVVTLYRPEMLQVRVDVRFEDIPKVSLAQPVQIKNPALADPLSAKVLFVSSEANIQKNTLQVKVALDNPPPVLKPEMLVEVTFLAPKSENSTPDEEQVARLYLPQNLVQRSDGGSFVWLADQSAGVVRTQPVTPGAPVSGGLVEIATGLTVTSRIVSRGGEDLADGDRIRVVGEESEAAAAAGPPGKTHHALSRRPEEED